jgi:hypothetical protein
VQPAPYSPVRFESAGVSSASELNVQNDDHTNCSAGDCAQPQPPVSGIADGEAITFSSSRSIRPDGSIVNVEDPDSVRMPLHWYGTE